MDFGLVCIAIPSSGSPAADFTDSTIKIKFSAHATSGNMLLLIVGLLSRPKY
jgi:hypothetical protein